MHTFGEKECFPQASFSTFTPACVVSCRPCMYVPVPHASVYIAMSPARFGVQTSRVRAWWKHGFSIALQEIEVNLVDGKAGSQAREASVGCFFAADDELFRPPPNVVDPLCAHVDGRGQKVG